MDLVLKIRSHISQKIISSLLTREMLPKFLMSVGAGVAALSFGAKTIGIHRSLNQLGLASILQELALMGLVILASGLVLDFALGQRRLLKWFKALDLSIQSLGKFFGTMLQLGLLIIVMNRFHLISYAFYYNVMILTFCGFVINHFLPHRYRLPFFSILCMIGLFGVFGPANTAWLLGIGIALIGVCHLPVPTFIRSTLLIGGAAVLIFLRDGSYQSFVSKAIWPVLGSMFVFRLLIYYYDVRHKKAPVSISRALSYFFMLPNIAFPLFPAVDYATFCRTHYNDDPYTIYQRGVSTLLRGVVHLLLYRCINYYLTVGIEDVTNLSTLVYYLLTGYLLILRISGQFHIIVGIMQLFGFNLPRVMDLYWLSSSFNDYWRRINIYWKDFIVKVFYYPAYFRMRKLGNTARLVIATLFGFLMTWLFHAFQWFWLQGKFLISLPDMLHWGILGLLVLATSLYESKKSKKPGEQSWTFGYLVGRTLKIMGTVGTICVLYSLWVSSSLQEWLALFSSITITFDDSLKLIPVFLGMAALIMLSLFAFEKLSLHKDVQIKKSNESVPYFKYATFSAVPILLLFLLGQPEISAHLGGKAQEVVRDLWVERLSAPDVDLLTRGYYENLLFANRFNSQLYEIYMKRPDNWPTLRETDAGRFTGDFLRDELVPMSSIVFHGAPFSTNRWGMRDKDYEKEKPAKTYRVALLGGSGIVGGGVRDDEVFEWLLEDRLNKKNRGEAFAHYEILNFGVDAYTALQQLKIMEEKVMPFQPDAVFYTATTRAQRNLIRHLVLSVQSGVDIPYPYLIDVINKANVNKETPTEIAYKSLKPYGREILSWVFQRISSLCQQQNIVPVGVYFPLLQKIENDPSKAAEVMQLAKDAGFMTIDLTGLWDNCDVQSLRVAEWDWHFNAKGHRILADRLYTDLQKYDGLIPFSHSANGATGTEYKK